MRFTRWGASSVTVPDHDQIAAIYVLPESAWNNGTRTTNRAGRSE